MRIILQTFIATSLLLSAHSSHAAEYQKREILGWTVHINPELFTAQPEKTKTTIKLLTSQLQRVVDSVPDDALSKLKKVAIWINPQYKGERPRAEYHPGKGWLEKNGRDVRMAKAIEISNVAIFEAENRRMPDLILHELAHAYHDRVLGFNEPRIQEAFKLAQKSGTYDAVQRFTGRKMITDKAYAMSNHKEYFAETTEAYFGKNDFYPFNREELQEHDPRMLRVLEHCWGVKKQTQP